MLNVLVNCFIFGADSIIEPPSTFCPGRPRTPILGTKSAYQGDCVPRRTPIPGTKSAYQGDCAPGRTPIPATRSAYQGDCAPRRAPIPGTKSACHADCAPRRTPIPRTKSAYHSDGVRRSSAAAAEGRCSAGESDGSADEITAVGGEGLGRSACSIGSNVLLLGKGLGCSIRPAHYCVPRRTPIPGTKSAYQGDWVQRW